MSQGSFVGDLLGELILCSADGSFRLHVSYKCHHMITNQFSAFKIMLKHAKVPVLSQERFDFDTSAVGARLLIRAGDRFHCSLKCKI